MPAYIRNISNCSVQSFKGLLDKVLTAISDEPQIAGCVQLTPADSNSLTKLNRASSPHVAGPDGGVSDMA